MSPTRDEISIELYGVPYNQLPVIGEGAATRREKVRAEWEKRQHEEHQREIKERNLKRRAEEEERLRKFEQRGGTNIAPRQRVPTPMMPFQQQRPANQPVPIFRSPTRLPSGVPSGPGLLGR